MAATLISTPQVPYMVVVPSRWSAGRPSTQVFVRRRLLVSLVLVAVAVGVCLGAGNVLANRGGDPASASTVRPGQSIAAAAPVAAQVYVAQPGDTMWSIAQQFHGSHSQADFLDALIAANGGTSLQVGQAITLP